MKIARIIIFAILIYLGIMFTIYFINEYFPNNIFCTCRPSTSCTVYYYELGPNLGPEDKGFYLDCCGKCLKHQTRIIIDSLYAHNHFEEGLIYSFHKNHSSLPNVNNVRYGDRNYPISGRYRKYHLLSIGLHPSGGIGAAFFEKGELKQSEIYSRTQEGIDRISSEIESRNW